MDKNRAERKIAKIANSSLVSIPPFSESAINSFSNVLHNHRFVAIIRTTVKTSSFFKHEYVR